MPSPDPRVPLRRFGWLAVLLTGATLFVSGVTGVSSVEGTLQAAQAEQREAQRVGSRAADPWDCPAPRSEQDQVRSGPAEV